MERDSFGLTGTLFAARYEVGECLADGRTGRVYAARDQQSGRDVALKVLHPALCTSRDVTFRFLEEARTASAIRHASVVEILDVGATANGWTYVVMERVVGENLSTYVHHTGALPWSRVRPLALQLCHAVDAGHRQGVLHRYLTPARCLRLVDGSGRERVKILGFGIASIYPGGERSSASAAYAAPEQLDVGPVDARADQWAVAAIIYELLTARRAQALRVTEAVADLSAVRPEAAGEVLRRALARAPDERFTDLGALAQAFDAIVVEDHEIDASGDLTDMAALVGGFKPGSLPRGRQLRRGDNLGEGRFELVSRLGQSGAVAVWLALDHERQDRATLKILHPEYATHPDRVRRFRQAVRDMATLNHPGISPVLLSATEEAGRHFCALAFVEGSDLGDAVRAGKIRPERSVKTILDLGRALAHAHGLGVLHEDIQPANVLVDVIGSVHLVDFGLARVADTAGGKRTGSFDSLVFLAPEVRFDADTASVASDVYSLAVLAVYLICGGELPGPGEPAAMVEWLRVPPAMRRVLARALATDPAERPAGASEFCDALEEATARAKVDWEAVADEPVDPRARQMVLDLDGDGDGNAEDSRVDPAPSSSGPSIVFVPVTEPDEDGEPAAESTSRGIGDSDASLERRPAHPNSRAQARIVATLGFAAVLCLCSLWMVMALRTLERELSTTYVQQLQCESGQNPTAEVGPSKTPAPAPAP